jgi:hypothetical protein
MRQEHKKIIWEKSITISEELQRRIVILQGCEGYEVMVALCVPSCTTPKWSPRSKVTKELDHAISMAETLEACALRGVEDFKSRMPLGKLAAQGECHVPWSGGVA